MEGSDVIDLAHLGGRYFLWMSDRLVTLMTELLMILLITIEVPLNWLLTLGFVCAVAALPHLQAAWKAARLAAGSHVAGVELSHSRCSGGERAECSKER